MRGTAADFEAGDYTAVFILAHNTCPLSYRSVNEADYKKAAILFYEQNSARLFKELFIEQFKFVVSNYFQA